MKAAFVAILYALVIKGHVRRCATSDKMVFVAVPEVVHLFLFDVLGHYGGKNCGSPMEDDGFLEITFIPGHLVLVGELLILGDGGQGSDVWVRGGRLLHPVAVERGVVGDVTHLGLLKDEG